MKTTGFRLQYSLRTLLFLSAGLCVWMGFHAERARRQNVAVTALQAMGCAVFYETEYDGTKDSSNFITSQLGSNKGSKSSSAAAHDLFRRAVIVYVDRTEVSAALPHLVQLPHLKEVAVSSSFCIYGDPAEELERQGISALRRELPEVKISSWWLAIVG